MSLKYAGLGRTKYGPAYRVTCELCKGRKREFFGGSAMKHLQKVHGYEKEEAHRALLDSLKDIAE